MVGFSRIPKTGNKVPLLRIEVDNSKARKELGIEFIPKEKTFQDTASALVEIEKQSGTV